MKVRWLQDVWRGVSCAVLCDFVPVAMGVRAHPQSKPLSGDVDSASLKGGLLPL